MPDCRFNKIKVFGSVRLLVYLFVLTSALIPFWDSLLYGELISQNRRINWSPGVVGGIPTYPATRNAIADDGAVGNGVADDTAKIQLCLNSVSVNEACYLPAGTYKTTAEIHIPEGVVLRGAGPTKTKIINYNSASGSDIISMGGSVEGAAINILSGYTKDSTQIIVENASSLVEGDFIVVYQDNNSIVDTFDCGWCGLNNDENHAMMQIVKITNKSGNTLTLNRPLYYTFEASQDPEVLEFEMIKGSGVENLYVELNASAGDVRANIEINQCANCWVRSVESYNANRSHVLLTESYGCEVRDSYFHHGQQYNGDHAYGAFIFVTNSDHLIENNIFYHLRHSMILEGGGSGNVYGYNYSNRMFGDVDPNNTNWLMADIVTHGAHPYMNLFEGNVAQHLGADYTHGSGSHNTFFRNQITRENLNYDNTLADQHLFAVDISKFNYYLNVVGNVLGKSSQTFNAYEDSGTRINDSDRHVYSFGYSNDGDTTSDDAVSKNTVLRHGNYDYYNKNVVWDAGIADHSLPASYYLSSKPSFFGITPWPLFGPDLNPIVGTLPAEQRLKDIGNIPMPPTMK
ncbi:MAG: hypothetical protein A3D21_02530 [Nitrospirae bacterium RIFCSPHIGHO2_02_FULL_42_12]|nr:MAG: hypothetical protein A3D21_02530 [Nitrospirae bacterium RIFCSPHIGHO2_02_FULL_42_12]